MSVGSPISFKFVPTTNSSEEEDFKSITDTLTVSDFLYYPWKEFTTLCSTGFSESGAFEDSVTFSSVSFSALQWFKDLGVPSVIRW